MSDVHGPELTAQPVGVIMPPREIRKIVDKTADFVARNGPSFEEVIMKDQMNNPKFSFLKREDPYRAYFDQKIAELARLLAAGTLDSTKTEDTLAIMSSAPQKVMENNLQLAPLQISQAREFRGKEGLKRELKAPPPDQYILNHPKIPALDIEIVKLTAQFVARNGQKFLLELTEREKQNPAFDFLKPNHANFPYFTSLADSYAKIIMLKQEELIKLQTNIKEKMSILGRCGDRFEYEKMKQQESKKKEELAEEERLAMAQIDWDNFVIVETINRFEDDLLPAAVSLAAKEEQKTEAPVAEDAKRIQEKRPQNAPITLKKPDAVEPQPQFDVEAGVKIKSNYVRKSATESNLEKCPLCKKMFPTSEINDHLRIEMLDPRYKDIKKEMEARGNAGKLDTSGEFFSNLKNFATKRPDLFGSIEEEFQAEGQGRPKAAANPVWDGSSIGLTRTTANVAMLAVQQKRNLEESQKVHDKMSGVIPAIVPTFPMPAGVMNPMFAASIAGAMGQSAIPQPTSNVGPAMAPMMNPMEPNKRAPTEMSASGLIPEDEWLEHHPGEITLRVRPQEHDESWTLKPGEAVEIKIDSRYTIGALKEMLSESFGGLPANQLKLRSGPHNAMKDGLTLAYYNLEDNAVIEVSKVRRRQ